jgi:hypothetical protein
MDESSKNGKLKLDLIMELGINSKEMPSASDYAFPSNRKISSGEINYLLDEAEISENLILKEEIEKHKTSLFSKP